jgi:uncharacterized protein (TIGR02453 family)
LQFAQANIAERLLRINVHVTPEVIMSYFTPEFLKFFRGLKKNNSKAWFDANKEWYETAIKKPFALFVEEIIARIRAEDAALTISAKEAIFRLNRDIRFSKDKRPYKEHMAANISPAGRANHEEPGFYLQFGPEQVMLGGGAYMVEKENLHKIRQAIVKQLDEFDALLKDKKFKQKFGTLQGEKNKVLPAALKEYAAKQPLVANKQFYYMAELEAETILKKNLPELVMQYYHAGKAMNAFLKRAMKG